MFRLIALGLFAVSACGQSAINPYDLARLIDSHTEVDWASVWKGWGVTNPPDLPRCDLLPCAADAITISKPSQVIVAVRAQPGDVYVRFLGDAAGWRYAGSQSVLSRNYGGRYEVSRVGDKPFLRVSSESAHGSDIDGEWESWYDLSLPDFEPVFGFTVHGYEIRFGAGVSRVVHANATMGGESVEVDLEVSYSAYLDVDLGFADYKATYARAANQKTFTLREVHPSFSDAPEISNKDFERLANIDGGTIDENPSNEQLLVYTLPRLKDIASGSDAELKDWLASVLSHCKDTPEKRTLQALLDKKR